MPPQAFQNRVAWQKNKCVVCDSTVEIPGEDFFVGVQFHPEFKSRPNKPHPLFMGFIGAAAKLNS